MLLYPATHSEAEHVYRELSQALREPGYPEHQERQDGCTTLHSEWGNGVQRHSTAQSSEDNSRASDLTNPASHLFLQIWAGFQCHMALLMLQHLRTCGKKQHSCPSAEVYPLGSSTQWPDSSVRPKGDGTVGLTIKLHPSVSNSILLWKKIQHGTFCIYDILSTTQIYFPNIIRDV